MITYGFPPLRPTTVSSLLYIQCLANSLKSTSSIRNYLSGVRTFLTTAGGDPSPLNSPMITTMLRGVARVSQHEEAPAPPLSRRGLFSLCDALERLGPDALVLRAAVLFGVASLLRQSNFLAASSVSRLSHLITRGDLRVSEKEVLVYVRSSKTLRPESGGVVLRILAVPGSKYCPVRALRRAWLLMPAAAGAPIFLLPSTGRPLRAAALTAMMRVALRALGSPIADVVTVHSLRRTGAHLATSAGASEADVMLLGTWTSGAVKRYLPSPVNSAAPATLAAVFAS